MLDAAIRFNFTPCSEDSVSLDAKVPHVAGRNSSGDAQPFAAVPRWFYRPDQGGRESDHWTADVRASALNSFQRNRL